MRNLRLEAKVDALTTSIFSFGFKTRKYFNLLHTVVLVVSENSGKKEWVQVEVEDIKERISETVRPHL